MSILIARPLPQRRLTGQRHALVVTSHQRLVMLLMLFAAGAVLIIARLIYLAAFTEPATSRDAAAALVPLRADIVDRNGEPLARTIDAWSIGVHPNRIIGDRDELARELADLIPEHDTAYFSRLLHRDVNFTYIQRRALPDLVEQVNALGEPGIVFDREPERLYPQSTMAAHALGFIEFSGHGARGMERALDQRLLDPAMRGEPVALSLDTRVQAAMESELGTAVTKFQALAGGGVVLDVNTGEVLAMVSLPDFNPNNIADATEDELRNNVTQSVYELGSTFKPIAIAAAIDMGVETSMSKRFDATKPIKVGRYTIHDDPGDEQWRWLNIPETLIYSSNIATARIADELGAERIQAMFRRLSFDTKPHIELLEKGTPLWPKYWARTTVMTTAYGHGIAVTPLHLANAYASLVNGGIWRPATLLKVPPGHAVQGRRVLKPSTSYRMRQLLRLIVMKGTGRKGDAPGFRVGAKTGTAEMADVGGYSRHRNVSTFAAAFPMDNPRYVVVATLVAPHGLPETYGRSTAAWNAAPAVARVIQRIGPQLGVIPDMSKDIDVSELLPLLWQSPAEKAAAGQ
ncbi:cell division protein FtsI (penicillin-binding protein 3) [Hephaestia caeni]|uniref:Cell division protein FtsI (Penicillin-binding protein 3) n=1 Tax=Hephaestia caeni TaxID=645617 RepID=A0A397PDM1_9SPHN|nr:penicillin-binding protein 2 [Hephaestia caeni]RIA47068.1 cell division protein FtsI (penicillin-binding protein 3) [Hephaestia caeni]